MIVAAPHIILPPERPALVRAADLNDVPSWQEMQRREKAIRARLADAPAQREGTFPFPMRPRSNVSLSFTHSATDTTDTATYVFGSCNIGAADPARYIAVGVSAVGLNANTTISSVLVAGNGTATIATQDGTGGASQNGGIFLAAVPTGTTANINVNMSLAKARCSIWVWRLVGLRSSVAVSTGGTLTPSGNDMGPISLNVPAFGCAVAVAESNTSQTVTWAGLTKDQDQAPEGTISTGASGYFVQQQVGLFVKATFSGAPSTPFIVGASFR